MIKINDDMRSKNALKAALAYAKAGWRIHPLMKNSKKPHLNDWRNKATSNPDLIKKWFKQYPDANIGGVLPTNIIVLDIDGEEGKGSFKSLGLNMISAKVLTPRGNHRYFEGNVSKSKIGLLKGLDLFSDDSRYLVLPPSRFKTVQYKWNTQNAIRPLESDFISEIENILAKSAKRKIISSRINEGSRNDAMFKIACTLRRRGIGNALISKALLGLNNTICEKPLPKEEVLTLIQSSARYDAGYEETFGDMSEVEKADINWFWYPYMARGCMTIIEGAPGQGKSYLSMYLAALTSTGGKFPFSDKKMKAGRVLILNAEDDPACILRPRLEKCGASFSKDNIRFQKKFVPMDKTGIELLETEISSYKPDLVIIDPLLTFMVGDMHRYNEATIFMTEIDELARAYKCCIVGIRHLTKSDNNDASKRGIGSVGFAARARSVIQVGKAPDDEDEKAMGHVKTNWGEYGQTLVFSLKGGGRDEFPEFVWERVANYSADEINKPKEPGRPSERDPIRYLLLEKLQEGAMKVGALMDIAKSEGLYSSKRTILRVLGDIAVLEGKGPKAKWVLKK